MDSVGQERIFVGIYSKFEADTHTHANVCQYAGIVSGEYFHMPAP